MPAQLNGRLHFVNQNHASIEHHTTDLVQLEDVQVVSYMLANLLSCTRCPFNLAIAPCVCNLNDGF